MRRESTQCLPRHLPLQLLHPDRERPWQAWLEIITFWIRHGIKIFRVDNPQTKPFPFWKWIIAEVQRDHPEVIFLSAAFSSPKVMKLLAKLGSTQSYTYLTWRNHATRTTGLHAGALLLLVCRSISAPNFFVNTPDILSKFLQTGGEARIPDASGTCRHLVPELRHLQRF